MYLSFHSAALSHEYYIQSRCEDSRAVCARIKARKVNSEKEIKDDSVSDFNNKKN